MTDQNERVSRPKEPDVVGYLHPNVSALYSFFLKKQKEWQQQFTSRDWVGLSGGVENGRVNPAKVVQVFGTEDEVRTKLKESGTFPILVQPLRDHVYSIG